MDQPISPPPHAENHAEAADPPLATTRRRSSRRIAFGTVRRLRSGRYQARFTDAREERRTAPTTFATKRDALDYLATVRADMVRGQWRAPELGAITLAAYAEGLLAVRVDLAPKTRQLYGELLRLWIDAPHVIPAGPTVDCGRERHDPFAERPPVDWVPEHRRL